MSGFGRPPFSLPPAYQVPSPEISSEGIAVQVSDDDSCRSVSEYFTLSTYLSQASGIQVSSDRDLERDSKPVSPSETSLPESDLEHDGEIENTVGSPRSLFQASLSSSSSSSSLLSSSLTSSSTSSKEFVSSFSSDPHSRHQSALFSIASLTENDSISESSLFEESNYQNSIPLVNTQTVTPSFGFSECRYPQYADEQARLDSFRNWPSYLTQTGHQLSSAGFYYTSWSDWVRCFCCGTGVRDWNPEDDPWHEHARWSPGCSFVRLMGKSLPSNDIECTRHQHEGRQNEQAKLPDSPLSIPSRISDNESDAVQPTSQKPHETDTYPEKTLERNPLLTDAAQSVLDMGYLPKQVKQAIDIVLQTKTWKTMTVEEIIDVMPDITEQVTPDSDSEQTQNEADGTGNDKTQDPEKLKETNETLREQTICKMCCTEKVSIVFLPCGHLVSCGQCSPALRKCPMCRQGIKGTVRVKFN